MKTERPKPTTSLEKTRLLNEKGVSGMIYHLPDKKIDSSLSKNSFLYGLDVSTSFLGKNMANSTTLLTKNSSATTIGLSNLNSIRSSAFLKERSESEKPVKIKVLNHAALPDSFKFQFVSQQRQLTQLSQDEINRKKKFESFHETSKGNEQVLRVIQSQRSHLLKEELPNRDLALPKIENRELSVHGYQESHPISHSHELSSHPAKNVERRLLNTITASDSSLNALRVKNHAQRGDAKTLKAPIVGDVTDKSIKSTNSFELNSKRNLQALFNKFTPEPRELPNYEPPIISARSVGVVQAYGASNNQGIIRDYNEDRIAIKVDITKPADRRGDAWPTCSYFGVFDGHGGHNCADFLRDNLHQYIIGDSNFPSNPKEAIMKGFQTAEKEYCERAQDSGRYQPDFSGSCAIVCVIVGDICYVGNVGDSRAIVSTKSGAEVIQMSKDHKPNEESEWDRISEAGGTVYQPQGPSMVIRYQIPYRVFPGKLAISRTFGDIEAKLPRYGGKPNVVIAVPEIKSFRVSTQHDFLVLASDGVFDTMSNTDVAKSVWDCSFKKADNLNKHCGRATDRILQDAIRRKTTDNVTALLIAFKSFQEELFPLHNEREPNSEAPAIVEAEEENKIASQPLKTSFFEHKLVNNSQTNQLKTTEEGNPNKISVEEQLASMIKYNKSDDSLFKNPFKYKLQKIIQPANLAPR